ncbi:glutamate ABC transporter substrate-binding protein [Thermocrispum municipale]|jgi:polar amino acid transport system substrate-binding protein|uniref:glutamate ABC transporter substrate-binding protein n=1 Tax=Thermocrispum municipale TaxID=37926 RepID=UPI0004278164|nr:glutamate ABC transporter substrate-binding protein [Thermocrispum municipale]
MRKLTAAKVAALLVASAVLTGCAAGEPRDLSPMVTAEPPMPANATINPKIEAPGGGEDDCGDPTVSLKPQGTAIPPGSTMDKIRKRKKLVVGVDQNTFLFGFRNPTTGQLEGFDIDIAKAIAVKLLGHPSAAQFRAITSQQRIDALKNGKVDIVVRTMTINCERRKDIEFSSVYYVAGQRVLVKKTSDYDSLKDLGGKRVCATSGSTSLRNIAQSPAKPIPVAVDNWSDCLVMMQQGQVEAISTDDTILAGMAQQDPTLKVVGERFTEEPYGIGIPKENKDMVRYVNAVLDEIRGGEWQKSYNKWLKPVLGSDSPPKPKYR